MEEADARPEGFSKSEAPMVPVHWDSLLDVEAHGFFPYALL
jgi:hypothetical protein